MTSNMFAVMAAFKLFNDSTIIVVSYELLMPKLHSLIALVLLLPRALVDCTTAGYR